MSGLTLIGLTFNQIWPQSVEALVGRIRARGQPRMPVGYMSLHDAADRLLDETLNLPLRSTAISHGRTLNGTWDWLGFYMYRRGLTVYGRHPSTKIMHAVPAEHFAVAGMRGGAAEMVRDGFTTWTGLAVKRQEFEARLEELKRLD